MVDPATGLIRVHGALPAHQEWQLVAGDRICDTLRSTRVVDRSPPTGGQILGWSWLPMDPAVAPQREDPVAILTQPVDDASAVFARVIVTTGTVPPRTSWLWSPPLADEPTSRDLYDRGLDDLMPVRLDEPGGKRLLLTPDSVCTSPEEHTSLPAIRVHPGLRVEITWVDVAGNEGQPQVLTVGSDAPPARWLTNSAR
jgi:hypothetical protein